VGIAMSRGAHAWQMILAVFLPSAVTLGITGLVVGRRAGLLRAGWQHGKAAACLPMLRDGIGFTITAAIAPLIMREGSKWIAAYQAGVEEVARLGLAFQLAIYAVGLWNTLIIPIVPAIADASARGDFHWIRRRTCQLRWLALGCGGAIVGSGPLLFPWFTRRLFGDDFALGIEASIILAVWMVYLLWSRLHVGLLTGVGVIWRPAAVMLGHGVLALTVTFGIWPMAGESAPFIGLSVTGAATGAWMLPLIWAAWLTKNADAVSDNRTNVKEGPAMIAARE
jgi:O-antigen/teichoic acid export membrane protein